MNEHWAFYATLDLLAVFEYPLSRYSSRLGWLKLRSCNFARVFVFDARMVERIGTTIWEWRRRTIQNVKWRLERAGMVNYTTRDLKLYLIDFNAITGQELEYKKEKCLSLKLFFTIHALKSNDVDSVSEFHASEMWFDWS